MSITLLKDVIRDVRREDKPATKQEVQETIAHADNPKDLMGSYQQAKRLGEIYEYPEGGHIVVKITDEVIA
jgi:hypothetical protein